ncbi:MAG: multiheme c-type cytochrome [Planctomycetota bacterium]
MIRILVPLFVAMVFAGCSKKSPPNALVIYFSSDMRGNIEPCGCIDKQSGGLPRRATAIRGRGSSARLLIEVGNATRGAREWDKLKFKYILMGLEKMDYAALNVGQREAALGRDDLVRMAAATKVPFVSANVVDAETRLPVVRPYIVRDVGGLRVGVTGILANDVERPGPGLAALDPEMALLRLLPELKGRCDFLILAACTDFEGMGRLAEKLYEVDVILGGTVREPTRQPPKVNQSILAAVADKGRMLGRLEICFDKNGAAVKHTGEIIELGEEYAEDPQMASVIAQMKEEQKAKELSDATTHEALEIIVAGKQAQGADRYVGAEECRECHKEAYEAWKTSDHARAFATLAAKKYEYDRDCLGCHVVGLGSPDGYRSQRLTLYLTNVQCENCHGRGKRHVDCYRAKKNETSGETTLRPATRAGCLRCHEKERSRDFEYGAYWRMIEH